MIIGQLAALGTSLCFSATSTFFTLASRAVTSLVVNRTRLLVAILFLTLAHFLLQVPFPVQVEGFRIFWLGLSGVIGLALGDAFLFQAFVWIGARLTMLMMSLAPVLATLMSWAFLGESLKPSQLFAILVTVAGIAWVVLERPSSRGIQLKPTREHLLGLLFGFLAALGQAGGLVTAKLGLVGDFSALSGTLIRMIAAAIALWLVTLLQRQARVTYQRLKEHPRALWFIAAGALFGPTIGVTLSLVAIQRIPIGIASTLTALPPIFLLPIGYFVFKERFGWQAILGTLLTIGGVAMLFLV